MARKIEARLTSTLWKALLTIGLASCGSSGSGSDGDGKLDGDSCIANAECVSGACTDGSCVGSGTGIPAGSSCNGDDECASTRCEAGKCTEGTHLPAGSSCARDTECAAGSCTEGVCETSSVGAGGAESGKTNAGGTSTGTGGNANTTANTTTGPQFAGAGESFHPLTTGCGPDTADLCTGECESTGGDADAEVVRAPATLCFTGEGDPTPDDPAVVIEQVIEKLDGQEYVHIRVTFDPAFTDNTYGDGASSGWPEKRGHSFEDLRKSDHTELLLTNGDADTMMHFKIDLIENDPNAPCGAASAGVSGGDGSMLEGDESHVLAIATSLDRNLGGCGYCDIEACGGDCLVHSPGTDDDFTPHAGAPDWDYRQVYETWIDMAAFGDSGFGQAFVTYTHSSPAMGPDTIEVEPYPCPPTWETPYCQPGDPRCEPGGGGAGGGGGKVGTGGSGASCPPNEQLYTTSQGELICTPIPFANYPGMSACPEGWVIDIASEGQYCVPAS